MNYLAHLHLASVTKTSLVGAILGDFVKGQAHLQFPHELRRGVILHRRVDSYTEDSKLIRRAKDLFPKEQRRLAGIALDIYWDHCLAREFSSYSDSTLGVFVAEAYQELSAVESDFENTYRRMTRYMIEYDWLSSYAQFGGVASAIEGLSRRRKFLTPLVGCISSLEENDENLTELFSLFYPELVKQAQQWVESGVV